MQKSLTRKLLKYLTVLVFGIPLLLAVGMGGLYLLKKKERPPEKICEHYADPIRIRLGKTEYRIMASYNPDLTNQSSNNGVSPQKQKVLFNRQTGEKRFWYCQAPDAPVWSIDHFFIRRHARPNAQLPLLERMEISVHEAYAPVQEMYCKHAAFIDSRRGDWAASKEAPDFLEAFDRIHADKPNSSSYYYSGPHRFFGLPFLIECQKEQVSVPSGTSRKLLGRFCTSKLVTGDSTIAINFYDREVPMKDWPDAFGQLESFFKQTTHTPLAETAISSCIPLK